jgi:exodeoxyribonuclease VII large subunit
MSKPQNLPILTVSQLTNAIKMSLESTFPMVWIQGEISNFKKHTSGHFYFSIKDASAQIAAVMYRAEATQLSTIPKDGTQIIVRGEINVYPTKGNYQLLVRELKPVGVGELLQKLEELKIKLLKKGYFKKEHKKLLPKFPKKIGVVTSPTGAAIHDILNILSRRFYGFHLILNPVKVQGEGAAVEIAQAIQQFNTHHLVDVIIVGRGGGSLEDLWAFNEEIVGDAIYQSHIPIISAVGHETDHCIADYVADIRAPTPSAAAEIVIAEKGQQLTLLEQTRHRLKQTLNHLIRQNKRRLEGMERLPLFSSRYGLLGPWIQKLDDLRQDIDQALQQKLCQLKRRVEAAQQLSRSLKPTTQITFFKHRLMQFDKSIQGAMQSKILIRKKRLFQININLQQCGKIYLSNKSRLLNKELKKRQIEQFINRQLKWKKECLDKLSSALHSIDPKNLISKGYAILFAEKDHSVITSVSALEINQDLRLLLSDGEILSTVKEIYRK